MPVPEPNHQYQLGLNLSEAWLDLHTIASRPHPYISHANDVVHAYLLARLAPIAAAHQHVHVVEDRVSNASFEQTYFEGTNILVKVDGTNEDQNGAVLFSAHYDSVSTSNGATDDGMAIVSMLQLVAKLAKSRSKRTAIFNFNNGEEDGLHGAHVRFLQHPWFNLTETFLNLEGSAAGGRPILFRGTSTKPLRAFHHKHVPHPHGTILASDAFAAGLIRSGTDYSVYADGGGLEGLDLAFYKGRSYYHTKYDAIPFLRGGTRALWNMMETADGAGRALLDQNNSEATGDIVFFDLVIFSQVGIILVFVASNQYVVYSSPYAVFGSVISLVCLVFSAFITPPSFFTAYPTPTPDLNALLLQLVVLTYVILLATTLSPPVGGTYLFTVFATCAFLGWLVGTLDDAINPRNDADHREAAVTEEHRDDNEPTEFTPLMEQPPPRIVTASCKGHTMIWFIQLLLVVPVPVILFSHIAVILLLGSLTQGIVDGGPVWIVYAALSLIATFLILPVAPFVTSFPHASPLFLVRPLQHANSPKTLSRILLITFVVTSAYTSGLLGILLSPTSLPATRLGFPFSIDAPMKVFFQQQVEVIAPWVTDEPHTATSIKTRSTTFLTGVPYYLDRMIVPSLPSALRSGAECIKDDDRKGLVRCGWPSGDEMLPFPGKGVSVSSHNTLGVGSGVHVLSANAWLRSSIDRASANTMRIRLHGTNTRACRVYFDNVKVVQWSVVGGSSGMQKGYDGFETVKGQGLTELRVWSRTWDREFVIDVHFVETPQKVKGRVACEWAEYESGRVGLNDTAGSTIPAYEEALRFFPHWATLTKLQDSLTEVWSGFDV
ncbi:hypothetical protein C0991_009438 [Blastosporella zonata]|nr:hypothetical protein C0991_009438 [Blastosporella zonata]